MRYPQASSLAPGRFPHSNSSTAHRRIRSTSPAASPPTSLSRWWSARRGNWGRGRENQGVLSVLEARNSNNPTLRPTGRSVGWNARRKSACQRHATTRLANSSVFSTRHRCAAAAITPHCAPLRYAYVGLLRYRASGTRSPFSNFFSIKKRTRNMAAVFKQ